MISKLKISPCLWFDNQAEEAAQLYCGLFPNSRIIQTTHYSEVGQEFHGKPVGAVMTVEFEVDGQKFTALNGGPMFQFTEAISFQVHCETQQEIDHYWSGLGEGGDPNSQQCGWLKDRFGVSWQVVPTCWYTMLEDCQSEGAKRAMAAMFQMKKLDIAELERAFHG